MTRSTRTSAECQYYEATCICDLTAKVCDANCCCDTECPASYRAMVQAEGKCKSEASLLWRITLNTT